MKPSFKMTEFYTFLTILTIFWGNLKWKWWRKKIDPKVDNTNIRNWTHFEEFKFKNQNIIMALNVLITRIFESPAKKLKSDPSDQLNRRATLFFLFLSGEGEMHIAFVC